MFQYLTSIVIFCLIAIAQLGMMIGTQLKEKEEATAVIRRVLTASFMSWMFFGMYFVSKRVMIANIGYTFFSVFSALTLYTAFLYVHVVIYQKPVNRIYKGVLLTLIIADGVAFVANLRHNEFFSINYTMSIGDGSVFVVKQKPLFVLHTILLSILVIHLVACIIRRIMATKDSSRKKLIFALTYFGLFSVLEVVTLVFSKTLEFSAFFVAGLSISIYLYHYYYGRRLIVDRLQRTFLENNPSAIYIYNADCKCIYYNKAAAKMLADGSRSISDIESHLKETNSIMPFAFVEEFKRVRTDVMCAEGRHIQEEFNRIFDVRGNYIGCCFIFDDVTKEHDRLLRQHFLAYHDELTGLYNKSHFCEKVADRINTHLNVEYLIVVIDIQHFKLVNDIMGREAGDVVLRKMAGELKAYMPDDSVYGRIGGDRFALCVPANWYSDERFIEIAEKATRFNSSEEYPLYCSIGVYAIHDRLMGVDAMIDRAVMALSSTKGQYANKITHYDDKFREGLIEERELVGQLSEAIESGQITIYLQPQISQDTGKAYGAEALVRWEHPEKGLIPPARFIPQLEKNGQIFKLDMCVWERTCELLARWKARGITDIALSVNISPRDFFYCDIYDVFTGLVKKYDIPPNMLRLEITETAIMNDFDAQKLLVRKLQDAGFVIEMDDFGSGYSSLNMLKDLVVDIIKMDMAFLDESSDEWRAKAIMELILGLGKKLSLPVIAEGVETKEQLEFLNSIGCTLYQGYYFDRPLPIKKFEDKYIA